MHPTQLMKADGKLTLLGRCGSESIDPLLLNRSQSDTVIKSLSEKYVDRQTKQTLCGVLVCVSTL